MTPSSDSYNVLLMGPPYEAFSGNSRQLSGFFSMCAGAPLLPLRLHRGSDQCHQ